MLSEQVKQGVELWIQQLTEKDMPIFSGTVCDVTNAVNSSSTSAADVAAAILKDASLTGRLLKMANSFHYNPTGKPFSTISRAVMVLGFNQVRALALSLLLVDSLSDGIHKDKLTEEMAQSFHAAVQAQELARQTKCKSPENVFVATLLSHLGNMAFWAFAGEKATTLLNLIDAGDVSEKDAEAAVLGFSLHQLTQGLSKSWHLGELLDKSLSGAHQDDPLVSLMALGQSLAFAAKSGWDSDEAALAMESVAKKLDLSIDEVQELAHKNAKHAKEITAIYGVKAASKQIPLPKIHEEPETNNAVDSVLPEIERVDVLEEVGEAFIPEEKADIRTSYKQPDTNLQLSIMQEITAVIEEKPNINIVLEMVLEGLYRGVGMDRSLFAIISKDGKTLTCKHALGTDNELLSKSFKIDVSQPTNVFNKVVHSKKPVHISADPKKIDGTLSRETLKSLGNPPYLIMPTIVQGKVIGVFIADRNESNRSIEDKDFLSFQQFCMQANMALTLLSI
tara:strand:+ start:41638 stop:43158 length:1521 start_codon:yes stop_codon:yes gene_type:complete